jgi:hypothetical protein
MDTSEAFDEFDERLALPKGARKRAEAAHNKLRDVLEEAGVAKVAILQGSFARKTMLPPLKDIDMVAFLADEHEHLKDEPGGSERAMEIIQEAIADAYEGATFDRSQHALNVDLGDEFTFDVVPGVHTEPGDDLIWIADRDEDRFELSDTRRVTDLIQERNQTCGGVFIHQVRMIRQWVKKAFNEELPGFIGECIVYSAITAEESHDIACSAAFTVGARLLAAGTVEVPGSSENVLDRLTQSEIDWLKSEIESARNRAKEALELASNGDHAAAIDVWHSIFGDVFPEAPKQSVEDALTGLVGGGVTSTGRSTTAAPRHRVPATRSWGR